MTDAEMKVEWGDGVSALDRTLRAIVLMAGHAANKLTDAGYVRDQDFILQVHEDGMPVWIEMKGEKIFEIVYEVESYQVFIRGNWIKEVGKKRRGFWSWFLGLFRRRK